MNPEDVRSDAQEAAAQVPMNPLEPSEEPVVAWEEIEAGRFMPRRIRGSCVGRALG